MKVAEIELEVLTPMFSYGDELLPPKKEQRKRYSRAEFRITELKSLMRNTFRELYDFEDLNDMKEKENILFGSMKKKSPIVFKGKCIKAAEDEISEMLPHKIDEKYKSKRSCLKSGKKVNFLMISNNQNLEIYIKLLIQASIIGSLGMRSRKGFGSFKINSIKVDGIVENKYIPLMETKPINILKNDSEFEKYKIRKIEVETSNEIKFNSVKCRNLNYPYIKNTRIVKIPQYIKYIDLIKKVSQLTHDRLYKDKYKKDFTEGILNSDKIDKNILGNCKVQESEINRFASPVCVSFWENDESKYMIIKELNYEYIFDKFNIRENEKREADEKYVDKYITELINIVKG